MRMTSSCSLTPGNVTAPSDGSTPMVKIGRVLPLSGFFHSARPRYSGLTDATPGNPRVWSRRRREKLFGWARKSNCGLIRNRSPASRSCKRVELSNSALRKPSCMKTRMTAKATPAMATSSRNFSRVSCSQARGTAKSITGRSERGVLRARSRSRGDRHVDLEVGEAGDFGGIVEPNAHFDHARVGLRGGIDAEHVLLADLQPDAIDGAGHRVRQRRAGDGRTLADAQAQHIGLIDFGDRVHRIGLRQLGDAVGADPLALAGVDVEHAPADWGAH